MRIKIWLNLSVIAGILLVSVWMVYGSKPVVQAATTGSVFYVIPAGNGDCSSWVNACGLQTALENAGTGDEIWVATGVYKPTNGIDRTVSFQLKSGVALYGGFAGSETSREGRDWEAHQTILSGDIGDEADNSDNSYHVVSSSGVTKTAVLDGFTITGGYAVGAVDSGGGMFNDLSSPALMNLIFSGNVAEFGAGIFNFQSSPTLVNVVFSGNLALFGGGGIFNYYASNPGLINVTFSGNTGGGLGGGIANSDDSNPTLANTILWNNIVWYDNQLIINQLYNNDNSTQLIRYSDIQGSGGSGAGWDTNLGTDSGGNIAVDPLFVRNPDPGDGDWLTPGDNDYGDLRVQDDSAAIDAGDNNALPDDVYDLDFDGITTERLPFDLDGNPRFDDIPSALDTGVGPAPVVDMGAYEAVNYAPEAVDDNFSTKVGTSLSIPAPGVLDNDSDPNGDRFIAILDDEPGSGSIVLNPDGSFDYTPELGFTGVMTFTYHASDYLLESNIVTVSIQVESSIHDLYLPLIIGSPKPSPASLPILRSSAVPQWGFLSHPNP